MKFHRICPNPKSNPKCLGSIGYSSAKKMRESACKNTVCHSCRAIGNKGCTGQSVSQEVIEKRKQTLGYREPTEEDRTRMCGSCGKKMVYGSVDGRKRADTNVVACSQCKMNATELRRQQRHVMRNMIPKVRGSVFPKGTKFTVEHKKKIAASIAKHWETRVPIKSPYWVPSAKCRGISGHYRGYYFRSSCELQFLLENECPELIRAELDKFKMPFVDFDQCTRMYTPDFFLRDTLYEIKHKGWDDGGDDSKTIKAKIAAGRKRCAENGWKYEFVELGGIRVKDVYEMRRRNIVKLDPQWEDKYQEWVAEVASA